jgi:hypothetical protein
MTVIPKRVIKIVEEKKNLWKAERQGYIHTKDVLIIVITK